MAASYAAGPWWCAGAPATGPVTLGPPARARARGDDVAGPLHDIRVVEVSTGIAGGYAGEAVRRCRRRRRQGRAGGRRPAPARGRSPTSTSPAPTARSSSTWTRRSARSSADAADLIAGADLVVEDGRLDPIPDGPVVVSITPYGRSSPWADRPATEFTVQAECGSLGARGTIDRPPVQAGGLIAEWVSGAYGAAAGLAAVGHARRGGPAAAHRRVDGGGDEHQHDLVHRPDDEPDGEAAAPPAAARRRVPVDPADQ